MEIGHIAGSFKFMDVTNVGTIDVSSSFSRKLELILLGETILVSSISTITTTSVSGTVESLFTSTSISKVGLKMYIIERRLFGLLLPYYLFPTLLSVSEHLIYV